MIPLLNSGMNVYEPVVLRFPNTDRWGELKVAVLESQLEDLYDPVTVEMQEDHLTREIQVVLKFSNPLDQVHFVLSQVEPKCLLNMML